MAEPTEPTAPIELTLQESGTLCNILLQQILKTGGPEKQPPWVVQLYTKLAVANDKLRGHD
jgi:hypothetical protein